MLSGECRIDAIPVNGRAVLIDGLRLRLDLRLAPAAQPAGHEQRTRSALLPRRVQRLAALAGLAALLMALAFWFAGGAPAPSHGRGAPATAVPVALPPAPPPAAPPAGAGGPQLAPLAPEVRPIVEPSRLGREGPAVSEGRPALPVAKSPMASRPSAPRPDAASPSSRRPPATDREMLDLFGDTK